METTTLERGGPAGGRLVSADGRTLPLRGMRLAARAGGGIARTRVEQRFANPYPEPLRVTYQLPLPADGALAGFAFRIAGRRVEGRIERRQQAREQFERALAEGRGAGLIEEDRSSLFTQEIGNIPPGVEVVAELEVDHPLAWVQGEGWEWRFPTTVAPRYLGGEGRVADAERVSVDVTEVEQPPRLTLELTIGDDLVARAQPTSPSHALRAVSAGEGTLIGFAEERGARLDRDVVVRWAVAGARVGTRLERARPAADRPTARAAYGLLTLVPPEASAQETLPRDLVVLLDTSGSMHGEPLDQAKAVLASLVAGLTERDRLELVAFATRPQRWKRGAVTMTDSRRAEALRWIAARQAGGGTEMRAAILDELRPQDGGGQRQVLLVTDGFVGFEAEIVGEVLQRLPTESRLHTLGVGSAVNRSLTHAAARAGRGVEAIVGPGEGIVAAVRGLDAALRAPLVVDLELSGSALGEHAPSRLPDLFAGSPARIAVALRPAGGELLVRGRRAAGRWEERLQVGATAAGSGRAELASRFGRERVEDLELELAAQGGSRALDERVEALGLQFRLATRRTSWVAISSEKDVDPTAPVREERIPHELAHGLSAEGLGLRAPAGALQFLAGEPAESQDLADLGELELTRRSLEDEELNLLMAEAPAPSRPAPRGRVVRLDDGDLVVEIESVGFSWSLPATVRLTWKDGRQLELEPDVARTTASGWVAADLHLRIVLRLPDGAPEGPPTWLELELDGRRSRVELG